jgi:hypothetical protein
MANKLEKERSHAFLLHCWHVPGSGPGEESGWRFRLTHVNKIRLKKGFAGGKVQQAFMPEQLR